VDKAIDLSNTEIVSFHRQFNELKFREIYKYASPDLKLVTTESDFIKVLELEHNKLGKQVSSLEVVSNTNFSSKSVLLPGPPVRVSLPAPPISVLLVAVETRASLPLLPIVRLVSAEAGLRFPAPSVALASILELPGARLAVVKLHAPWAFVVVVPMLCWFEPLTF
jgi:hypothetical protein